MGNRIAKRVLLIGWDAADWRLIRPLVDAGHMPTLAALIPRGVAGNLATIQPILSPMLWNSIATGKRADKHGISSFVEPLPDGSGIRPASSTSRKCKAIWNILTQAGLRSNVVSWFASHPAEPIRGSIVTDRYAAPQISGVRPPSFPPGTFHPPQLERVLAPLAVSPKDIEADALLPFIPRAGEIDQENDPRLAKLAVALAKASTVQAAACRLATKRDWDFMAVYYSAIDEFGHHFMPYHPPRMPGTTERDAAIYGDVMTGCYRFHDMMLEALLAAAGEDTTVVLVSDHGFHSGHLRPSADAWHQPETWHREFGIACLCGPGIQQGANLYGATLLDVTPTILAMLGLAVGDDMDGRPWLEVLDSPVRPERIESWEKHPGDAGQHPDGVREDPLGAAEMIRQLVALGYVDPPSADADETVGKAIRDAKINLAVAVSSSRRAADALPLWEELVADYPEEEGFKLQLAACLLRLGRWSACYDAIEDFGESVRRSPFVQLMLASIARAEGRKGDALALVRDVASQPVENSGLANRAGQLFLELESWDEAEASFRKSLTLVDENPVALDGISQTAAKRGDYAAALEQALLAVGLMHFFPAAHFHLAESLEGLGRNDEAIAAYETALGMGYEPAETHRRLARMYRLRNPEKARRHEQMAGAVG